MITRYSSVASTCRRLLARARVADPIRAAVPLVVAAVLLLGAIGVAHANVDLVFGVYTSDKPVAMVNQLRPTLDLLETGASARLGEPVKIQLRIFRDYQLGVASLVAGKIDMARLGAASYVQAKSRAPEIELLAAEKFGNSHYFEGVICVNAKSPIHSVADLAGKTFAFGSKRSTIGRYLAQLYLAQHGITASKLAAFQYLERHDRVGMAVGAGAFDAGALEGTMFHKLVAAGVPIRAIASFPNVTKAWVARARLAPRVREALAHTLVTISDPKALAALRFDGFVAVRDSDYDVTRTAIEKNAVFFDQSHP
ncbi:MAG: PhnD/SsuA/transferrin family substrate-binding protein [Alphaproteobacteria bacterium]|nr:PhnD/SsuA/transferrin family substrate-binding protein [Alphaproteobacteria bacterium]